MLRLDPRVAAEPRPLKPDRETVRQASEHAGPHQPVARVRVQDRPHLARLVAHAHAAVDQSDQFAHREGGLGPVERRDELRLVLVHEPVEEAGSAETGPQLGDVARCARSR